jgi:DNA repair exonuclease SbcCD nuclease subunit
VTLPELNCAVYGRAFTQSRQTESPLLGFQRPDDDLLHLMVLHGETAQSSAYGPLSANDISASGMDYLALGHIHQYSGLNRSGITYWAYPGCPEGRGFDELGEKGVLYVEAEPGNVSAQFVPLGLHRYELLTVDLTDTDPLSAILSALPQNTASDIYRITLTGEGPAPDLVALEQELSARFYGLTLLDRTRLPQDLWQRRTEDTLTGLFLRSMWARCQNDPEDPVCQLAARFGLAALEQGEDVSP